MPCDKSCCCRPSGFLWKKLRNCILKNICERPLLFFHKFNIVFNIRNNRRSSKQYYMLYLLLLSFGKQCFVSFCFTFEILINVYLKELKNCSLCIIHVRSLFCSVQVYVSLHFVFFFLCFGFSCFYILGF